MLEEKWLREHLEDLVKKRAGQFLVIAGNEGFVGSRVKPLLSKVRKKYPRIRPLIMEIPKEKDFLHVLTFGTNWVF